VSADPFVLHYGLQFTMGSAYRYDKHDWSHQDMLTCSATRAGPLFPATPPIESLKGTPDYPKDKEEMAAYKLMEETIEVLNTALAIHHRVRAWVQSHCALPTAAAPRFAGLSTSPNCSSLLARHFHTQPLSPGRALTPGVMWPSAPTGTGLLRARGGAGGQDSQAAWCRWRWGRRHSGGGRHACRTCGRDDEGGNGGEGAVAHLRHRARRQRGRHRGAVQARAERRGDGVHRDARARAREHRLRQGE